MPFCEKCGKEIAEGATACSSCGASIPGAPPAAPEKVEFDVGKVLGSSLDIIKKKPIILLPHIITTVIFVVPIFFIILGAGLGAGLFAQPILMEKISPLIGLVFLSVIAIVIVGIIIGFIIEGMYPLMVKNVLDGKDVELSAAFGKAIRRLPSLIAAAILVGLIVVAGLILFVIPGILFLTWYYYTVPAIMLEDRGALNAMSTSRRFGRTRKWKTFLILLVLFVIGIIGNLLGMIPIAGVIISAIVGLFVAVWGSIIPTYVYIKYAMAAQATPPP